MAKKITLEHLDERDTRDIFGVVLNGEVVSGLSAMRFMAEPEMDRDPWWVDSPQMPSAEIPPKVLPSPVKRPAAPRKVRASRRTKR